jgi:hypothetical protein
MYDHDKGTYASEVADVGEEYQHHGGDVMHHIGNKILPTDICEDREEKGNVEGPL